MTNLISKWLPILDFSSEHIKSTDNTDREKISNLLESAEQKYKANLLTWDEFRNRMHAIKITNGTPL